ncbi:MAG TPA: DUF6279 family lipoprotein [Usitatibacter sp.]|jgi:hypothetical protein
MKRVFAIALACAACLLATACALGKIAYSNPPFAYKEAPPALAWMVGDYVDLSGEQKDLVRDRVHAAFAWHRAEEIPQYKQFCERMLSEAADGISVDEARGASKELRGYYERTLEHVIPDIADLLVRLDSEQAAYLEGRFAKDNQKMVHEAESGTVEERNAARAKKYVGHLEEFVGTLSPAQRAIVARHLQNYDEATQLRLADRQHRQTETLRMVRNHVSREAMIAGLHTLLIDSPSWRNPEYRRKLAARDEDLFAMISELSATFSQPQRTHLETRVRGFIHDMDTVSAQR